MTNGQCRAPFRYRRREDRSRQSKLDRIAEQEWGDPLLNCNADNHRRDKCNHERNEEIAAVGVATGIDRRVGILVLQRTRAGS